MLPNGLAIASSHILSGRAISVGTARGGTGWHLRGNIGATSSTEIHRDLVAEIGSKSLVSQLDRDRPRSQRPPINPKVAGSNPARPKKVSEFVSRRATATQSQPKWVTKAASSLRTSFLGDPKPVSISYQGRRR